MSFRSASRPAATVEVTTNRALRERVGDEFFARPDRPSFELFLVMESGRGWHTVDFRAHRLEPGRMVRVRSGQVQQWDFAGDAHCWVVMSADPAADSPVWRPDDDASRDLDAPALTIARSLIEALRIAQAGDLGHAASARLMSSLFDGLRAVFDGSNPIRISPRLPAAYVDFLTDLENDLAATHHVRDRARRLGYSERTLSRACQEATGLTAKQMLGERLVLEAKRLLVHTDLTAGRIGAQLGFLEATNFHRFFRRRVGTTPAEFRAAWSSDI